MKNLKNDKGFLITVILMFLAIVALLFYYFSLKNEDSLSKNTSESTNNNVVETINNTTQNEEVNENVVSKIEDYNVFFTVSNIINDYYDILLNEDKTDVLNILDEIYITENQINSSNVNEKLKTEYTDFDFFPTIMYKKENSNLVYYFVNGELNKYLFAEETLYTNNYSLILINDKQNKSYSILPIEYNEDLESYANNYTLNSNKEISFNAYNRFTENTYNAKEIALRYIIYYKNLIYVNTEKAYSMLSEDTLKTYPSLEEFTNNLDTIYDDLSTNIYGYSSKDINGYTVYSVKTKKGKTITFSDKNIMDFTVKII